MGQAIEISGYTLKEEEVNAMRHNILSGTFVIDVCHPFPGFYGNELLDPKSPRSVIFITKKKYTWESILRANKKINHGLEYDIVSGACEVRVWNTVFDGIRVKGFPSYEVIPNVQHAFKEEGFDFMKKKKMLPATTILMKVKKFFQLEEIGDGIYKDLDMPEMSYIEIPEHLNWEIFRNMTMKIKNNISNRSYDVVEGVFYKNDGITDMLRIYKPNIELSLLEEIKESYLKEISNLIH